MRDRFSKHDEFESCITDKIYRSGVLWNKHIPDKRFCINGVLFSIDFKTTRNVEKNSHDTYFNLVDGGELVAICYNNRAYENAEDGEILIDWIDNLIWSDEIPPSPRSRSGDPYYRISGGLPLDEFLKRCKETLRAI